MCVCECGRGAGEAARTLEGPSGAGPGDAHVSWAFQTLYLSELALGSQSVAQSQADGPMDTAWAISLQSSPANKPKTEHHMTGDEKGEVLRPRPRGL